MTETVTRPSSHSDRLRVSTDRVRRPDHIRPSFDARLLSIGGKVNSYLAKLLDAGIEPNQASRAVELQ